MVLVAVGEVLWFECVMTDSMFLSLGLTALSSVVAACADIRIAIRDLDLSQLGAQTTSQNVGYVWISLNCVANAAFVFASRRKANIHKSSEFDGTVLSSPGLMISYILHASFKHTQSISGIIHTGAMEWK